MQFVRSMDAKQTLINLHSKFPEFDLDTLFTILDCYVENYTPILTYKTDPILGQKIY